MTKPAFLRRAWMPALALLLPMIGFCIALGVTGVFPLGAHSMTVGDMNSQYLHFFAHLRRALTEGTSLTYTFDAGMGSNTLPLITYYLASPLSLLVVAFPADLLPTALLTMTVLKVGLMGLAYALFARHALQSPDRFSLLFAVCYALCSYALCYATNVMWLDALVCLPLILWGLTALVRQGRWRLFTLALAASFFTQFYLSYMTGLLVVLWLVWLLVSELPARIGRTLARFAGSVALAAGLAAVLLLPTALRLLSDVLNPNAVSGAAPLPMPDVPTLLARLFFGVHDTIQGDTPEIIGGAPLFCGTVTLLLMAAYCFNKEIPLRDRLAALLLNLCILPALIVRPLTFVWHAFDYAAWFQFRFSFVLVMLWIVMAHRCLLAIGGVRVWVPAAVSALALAFLHLAHPLRLSATHPAVPALLTALLILWPLLLALYRLRPAARQVLATVMTALAVAEMLANAALTLWGVSVELPFPARTAMQDYLGQRAAIHAQLPPEGDEPYRTAEDTASLLNSALSLGQKGFNYYATTADRAFVTYLNRLGLKSESVVANHQHSTIALDSLWGLKYVLAKQPLNDYYYATAADGDLTAYENQTVFPLAFTAPANALDYQMQPVRTYTAHGERVLLRDDIFALQNAMFRALFGQDVFVPMALGEPVYDALASHETADGEHVLRWIEDSLGVPSLSRQATAQVDGPVYAYWAKAHGDGSGTLTIDGQPVLSVDLYDVSESHYVGDYAAGDMLEAAFLLDGLEVALTQERLYSLDIAALEAMSDVAYAGAMTDVSWRDGDVRGSVHAGTDQVLFATIPYDGGWRATVDGQPAQVLRALDVFTAVRVPEGEHTVRFTYSPPGLTAGCWVSAVSVLAFVALCLRWRKRAQ